MPRVVWPDGVGSGFKFLGVWRSEREQIDHTECIETPTLAEVHASPDGRVIHSMIRG